MKRRNFIRELMEDLSMLSNVSQQQHLDLSLLTEQGKQELLDFYQFLLERYSAQKQVSTLPEVFYTPIKTTRYQRMNREEIYHERTGVS